MNYLVVIPARGGSKGIRGKNIKLINGKPLIHYTIETAREVFDDQNIFVSTDSPEIKSVAEQTGLSVPYLRPKYLATDTANSRDVLLHTIDQFAFKNKTKPDVVILLQPTSPLRKTHHIKEAIKLYSSDLDMVVSVKETQSNPYYVLFEENESGFLKQSKKGNFTTRQSCPDVWEFNGAIYIINVKSLEKNNIVEFSKIIKYVMPSNDSIDIDTELDFLTAELILKKQLDGE